MKSERFNGVEVSNGARELLRIALENDHHGALANNASLFEAIDIAGPLWGAAKAGRRGLESFFGGWRLEPPCFLELVGATLQSVRRSVEVQFRTGRNPAGVVFNTDFDRHALQGLADALADVAWPERCGRDFDGPDLELCARRICDSAVLDIWTGTVRNYVGNILQHYFSATEIRRQAPDLEPETEVNLRVQDAAVLAESCRKILVRREIASTRHILSIVREVLHRSVEERAVE